jgi:hypothetical protein
MTIDFEAPAGASLPYVQPPAGRSILFNVYLMRACHGTRTGRSGLGASVNDITPNDQAFEYEVIGEHLLDPMRLLTIDGDGRLFALNLQDGSTSPAELTADWVVDVVDTAIYRRRMGGPVTRPHTLVVG